MTHRIRYRTLEQEADSTRPPAFFIHPRRLLPDFPSVTAPPDAVARIRHGNAVNLPEVSRARYVKVFQGQTELLAIAQRIAGTLFHPKVVMVGEASQVAIEAD